jgi:uncharacterized protein (TIGR04255 family)
MLAQVRFAPKSRSTEAESVERLHEALEQRYPRLVPEQQTEFTVTPGGVQTAVAPVWRLTDLTKRWSLVVGIDHFTVETTAYTEWADFYERLREALEALEKVMPPRVRERIGLRYINEVPSGADVRNWSDRISPTLLGPIGEAAFTSALSHALSEIKLIDQEGAVVLRHGVSYEQPRSTEPSYLIDIDCFDDTPVDFGLQAALERFTIFNDVAFRLFRWSLVDTYYEELRGARRDADV